LDLNVIRTIGTPSHALSPERSSGHIDRHGITLVVRGRRARTLPVKIYTRTGDQGETGLFGGGRVPKDHPRVAAYGDVDELNSAVGVARAAAPEGFFEPLLESIQRDLFSIGGHLATPDPERVAKSLQKASLAPERVSEFERIMDEAGQSLPPLAAFVLPAGTPIAAALHQARTVCRRAERSVVHLAHTEPVPELFVVYLNRLSDLLFTLARLANLRAGVRDVTW
jgi:cob(I)alamin adenosyltransferase